MPKVIEKIGLSKSSIYERLDSKSIRHDPSFPKPVQLGGGKNSPIGFIDGEIEEWLEKQILKRDASL